MMHGARAVWSPTLCRVQGKPVCGFCLCVGDSPTFIIVSLWLMMARLITDTRLMNCNGDMSQAAIVSQHRYPRKKTTRRGNFSFIS